jgi:serine/threonine protein kinase
VGHFLLGRDVRAAEGDLGLESSDQDTSPELDQEALEIDETAMFGEEHALVRSSAPHQRMAGDNFGRYRILKTLGEGAMGSVYLALDSQLNRKVALKIPKASAQEDSKFVARFLREARSCATLSHPNICPVYDVGEINGTHFITMAYVQGQPLSQFINPEKPHRDRNVAYLVRRVALALHEAHINGLVHRDVKPANIMIDQRNEPIIMDFGLARYIDDTDDARLTRDGAILGSPAYMSPEQIEARTGQIGPACDVYSLGVIFYELLTAQLPFRGSVASIIGQIVSKEPEHPCAIRPEINPRLAEICMKAIAKRQEDRYASMRDFALALADFLKSRPEEKPPSAQLNVREKPAVEPPPKEATDTDAGLSPTTATKKDSKSLEVVCLCGQRLLAKLELAGKRVKCPRCHDVVTLPDLATASSTSRHIVVACQQCSQRFLARGELAGKAVRCPVCSRPLTVPRLGEIAPTLPHIDVTCACGQQFVARPNLAGKRVRCTACGRPLDVPAAKGK